MLIMEINANSRIPASKIYTVTRGQPISEVNVKKLMDEAKASPKSKQAALLQKIKKIQRINYGGAFYSVAFRTDVPITLLELGFFGPFEKMVSRYSVHTELFEPLPKEVLATCASKRIGRAKIDIVVQPNTQLFTVDFGDPVPLQAKKWYLVQFMIDGPDTKRCEKTADTVTVPVGTSGGINFEFGSSSKQMPVIKFTVPEY